MVINRASFDAFVRILLLLLTCLLAALATSKDRLAAAERRSDLDEIRHVMKAEWDKPKAPLTVEPIVVIADHAIAGWRQGDTGGRALFRRKAAGWQVVLCSGDQLNLAATLMSAGIAASESDALLAALVVEEAKLPTEVVARFSLFHGLVNLTADSASGQKDAGKPH